MVKYLLTASVICLTLLILALSGSSPTASPYSKWKQEFGLVFSSAEDLFRQKVFYDNLRLIEQHNSKTDRTFDMGINMFTATTLQQWKELNLQRTSKYVGDHVASQEGKRQLGGPVIDWQAQGAVTKVVAQGQCLAMYAFAAVGAAEGLSAIYFRAPAQLSAQQVLDCSSVYGNRGCDNGTTEAAFDFIVARGLMTANDYPYNTGPLPCRFQSGTFKGVKGYSRISGCDDLALTLAKQPVAVAIDGTYIMYYRGGLFGQCDFDPNYPMLLTGMTDSYWRLKASIGVVWGEQGYIRLVRGNSCGVCMSAMYPTP